MKRSILLLCAAPLLALTACVTGTPAPTSASTTAPPIVAPVPETAPTGATPVVDRASAVVDRAETAYRRVKPYIDFLAGVLPIHYADKVKAAQAIIERGLAAARIATSAAAQLDELRKVEAAMRDIEAVTGKPMTSVGASSVAWSRR